MTNKDGNLYNGIQREWIDYDAVKTMKQVLKILKVALEAAVRQLMSDVPYGVITFWRIRFFYYWL
jgi:hypothetical protein